MTNKVYRGSSAFGAITQYISPTTLQPENSGVFPDSGLIFNINGVRPDPSFTVTFDTFPNLSNGIVGLIFTTVPFLNHIAAFSASAGGNKIHQSFTLNTVNYGITSSDIIYYEPYFNLNPLDPPATRYYGEQKFLAGSGINALLAHAGGYILLHDNTFILLRP